jgi:LmbE family N-acetylglucosaminyl deacetylase
VKYLRLVAVLLMLSAPALAQDRIEIGQTLLDLNTPGVLMDISAHPDDEDGATLAYYHMKHGVHTFSVLFTRGEGGQNEKGSELYEDLGVIRTAETRAAGTILGAEVEFLNFPDFGYSKSATEAFRMWGGQQEVLRRLVYMIRKIKPDIMFSNHNTWGGHGHHQAVAITAIEAFDAAADSSVFPDQLREPGIAIWQPKKLFLRVFGPAQGQIGADVTHNLEEIDKLHGVAYLDVATTALRKHRTQGLDRADLRAFNRGRSAYRLARASSLFASDSADFFSGVWTWDQEPLASLKTIANTLRQIKQDDPWDKIIRKSSEALHQVDVALTKPVGTNVMGRRILNRWHERLEHLAAVAAGIECIPVLADSILVPNQKVSVSLRPRASHGELRIDSVSWALPLGWTAKSESPSGEGDVSVSTLQVGRHPRLSFPRAEYLYRPIEDGNAADAHISYEIDGQHLTLTSHLSAEIAPSHVLTLSSGMVWVQPKDIVNGISLPCTVTNMLPYKSAGTVNVAAPAGWKASGFSFALERESAEETGLIRLIGPANVAEGEYQIRLSTEYAERLLTLRIADVAIPPRLRVGLVSSYDTTIAASLREMNIRSDTLSDDALAKADLHGYHTILVDMRAYLVRNALRQQNSRLLQYVHDGGNLVVMYQREGEWKPEYAPYPFTVSRLRVTMEDAPITVLLPRHPLLTWPNHIVSRDWDGWKQERSVYLPANVPAEYSRLITAHDPDEPEGDTGYLVAQYGQGSYVYTTYVWYRQLKDRHPGALRCLANMVSYPLRPQ